MLTEMSVRGFVSVLRSEIFQSPIIRFSQLHIKNQPFYALAEFDLQSSIA